MTGGGTPAKAAAAGSGRTSLEPVSTPPEAFRER
jgi:hypothetical protein